MCFCLPRMPHFDKDQRQTIFKWMSLTFVIVFVIHGLVNIGVSIWLELYNVSNCGFLTSSLTPVHILIVAGCSIVFMCAVTFVYNKKFKTHNYFRSFTCILAMVVMFEISSAIAAAVINHRLENKMFYGDMERHLKRHNDKDDITFGSRESHQECWVDLQTKYKCCGVDGINDFFRPNVTNSTSSSWQGTPYTEGCKCTGGDNCVDSGGPYRVYGNGCYETLKDTVAFVCLFTRIFGPVFGLLQAIGYIIMNIIFTKMTRASIISAYKPKSSEVSFQESSACP